MRFMSVIVTAAVLTTALSGCSSTAGSQSSTAGPSSSTQVNPANPTATGQAKSAEAQPPTDFSNALGCSKTTEEKTEEIYVKRLFMCTRSSDVIKVYTFTDGTARDNWWKFVQQMGMSNLLIQKADTWIAVKNI